MKQYRITSEHFVPQGETGDADAVMDPQDLYQIKKLAGLVTEGEGAGPNGLGGVYNGQDQVPGAVEGGIVSPVGTNITDTAQYRNQLLDKYKAKPGDDLWFLINFEPVRGLGANSGTLEDKIEAYFKRHPEKLPENLPQLPN
jgi:hypothetical protein